VIRTAVFAAITTMVAVGLQIAAARPVTLIGLDEARVEKAIGIPDEKYTLADSDEAYWIYKTPFGTLSVHFEDRVVVDITPDDFPIDKIAKT
jgi:hypothetical protein